MAGHWVALVGRLGALLLLCVGLIAGTVPVHASPELPPLPPATASAATGQEITLGALGLTTQAATGPVSSLEFAFPPPAGPLAGSGSFARIFFSHSPLLDPASALTVLINGQPLTSVNLTSATAAGSVFEVRLPAEWLRTDRSNRLEARFEMSTSASAGTQTSASAGTQGAYARVDPQTLIHYQLLLAPATASPALLELYPFSVLRNDGHLGIVLPTPPRDADLRSAFRLAADLGRRAAGVEVQPEIVASGADGWLHAGGSPAILLGTTDRLPQAAEMLRRTGFVQSGGGWTAPGGETVTREDGLLVAGTSPWDGQSAILLVSGQTDEAVAAAAATIASAGQPAPAGRYAIVTRGPRAVRVEPSAAGRLTIGNFDEGIEARGPGSRAQSVSFSAPPVGSEGIGSLRLKLSQNTSQAGTSSIWMRVNGVLAGSSILSGARQDGVLRLPVSGSLLKPGLNSLTIGLDLAGPPDTWARVSPGAELVLPRPPADVRLELLPDPLFRDPGGVLVVLGGRSDAILGAAARVLTALGGRTTALPILDVADAATVAPSRLSRSAVIAIGAHDNAHGLLNRLGQLMPHPAGGEGVVELRPMVASTSHAMLWIDGGSPDLLAMPAAALARHPLPGVAISVDGAGRVRAISEAGTPLAGDPLPLVLSRVLIVTACAAVVLLLSWQVVWPREVNV